MANYGSQQVQYPTQSGYNGLPSVQVAVNQPVSVQPVSVQVAPQGQLQHAQVPLNYSVPQNSYPQGYPQPNLAYQPNQAQNPYQPPPVQTRNPYVNHGVTSRPSKDNSLSYGSIQADRAEYVLQNPVDPRCVCGKPMYYSKYLSYAQGLQSNITTVQNELRPRYTEIQAKLTRGKTNTKLREFKFYLERVLAVITATQDQIANLATLTASPTQDSANKLAALINGLDEIASQLPSQNVLTRLESLTNDQVAQFQLGFYQNLRSGLESLTGLNNQLKTLYGQWIGSLQAVFSPEDLTLATTTLTDLMASLRDYISQQYDLMEVPLEKPYGQVDAVEDLQKMQLEGKRRLGDLNQALFQRLLGGSGQDDRFATTRGCCSTTLADAARRGIIDEDIPPINEEAAYTPSLWPHLV